MRAFRIVVIVCFALLASVVMLRWALSYVGCLGTGARALPRFLNPEEYARDHFYRNHPGEKPLNWKIAQTAQQFYQQKPMGRFVLDSNDCSDFVDCVVDEALGAQARFNRNSDKHIYMNRPDIWQWIAWTGKEPIQPGDILYVRHSPWYPPRETRLGHIGVVGADGMVYDFAKLKSWSQARYGRNQISWFVRHSPDRGEIIIGRLGPAYRYLLKPLPPAESQ